MSEQSDETTAPTTGTPSADMPEPTTDEAPPVGPGGVDAVPDWEDAGSDAVVPDPPRSAQVETEGVPDEIDQPEGTERSDADTGDESAEPAD